MWLVDVRGGRLCWMFVSLDTTQRVRYYASDIIINTRHFLNVVGQMTPCSEDIQQMSLSLCISEDPVGVSAYLRTRSAAVNYN